MNFRKFNVFKISTSRYLPKNKIKEPITTDHFSTVYNLWTISYGCKLVSRYWPFGFIFGKYLNAKIVYSGRLLNIQNVPKTRMFQNSNKSELINI